MDVQLPWYPEYECEELYIPLLVLHLGTLSSQPHEGLPFFFLEA